MDKKKLNKKRLKKIFVVMGTVILIAGLLMIPYNIYYWNHQVGCSVWPSFSSSIRESHTNCWGQDTANLLDTIRNILIILGIIIIISVPLFSRIGKYLYSEDK